jgi:hypothetical protein
VLQSPSPPPGKHKGLLRSGRRLPTFGADLAAYLQEQDRQAALRRPHTQPPTEGTAGQMPGVGAVPSTGGGAQRVNEMVGRGMEATFGPSYISSELAGLPAPNPYSQDPQARGRFTEGILSGGMGMVLPIESTARNMLARPWYRSTLREAIERRVPNRASAQQIRNIITSPKSGVKREEVLWTGLDDFLEANPKTTQAEVLDYLDQNQVQVAEVMRGEPGAPIQWQDGPGGTMVSSEGTWEISFSDSGRWRLWRKGDMAASRMDARHYWGS